MAATFVPSGALSLNPSMLSDENLETEMEAHLGVDAIDVGVEKDAAEKDDDFGRTSSD